MVGSVSQLIREIRNKFLTSSDFEDPSIIEQLEEAFGISPYTR